MKILYLDCFSGISGDMLLGAFIDAGLDERLLLDLPRKLNLPQVKLEIKKVNKAGLQATKTDVIYPPEHVHRHLTDIEQIIDKGDIPADVKTLAKRIFTRLAEAEAEVHGTTPYKIHFHEVGALDAIIDITGTAMAFLSLGISKVYNSPISVGGGMVQIAHGFFPVPAPATACLLSGFEIKHGPVNKELVTPTGAAILSVLTENSEETVPPYVIQKTGYGAGTQDLEGMPNVLRIVIGTTEEKYYVDEKVELSFNVDDMNPQLFPNLITLLLEAGAADAFVTSVIMKKGRPGFLFTTIYDEKFEKKILKIIFDETTTIGIRKKKLNRIKLKRELSKITTSFGVIAVKKIIYPDGSSKTLPEYEECKRISVETNQPLKIIQDKLITELNFEVK
jgi:uncharacterized protein (TIGR00299 family) protein